MTKVNTIVSVVFTRGEGNLGLRLEEHESTDTNGFFTPQIITQSKFALLLRQYPAVSVDIVATIGSAKYRHKETELKRKESVSFSGTRASTSYPVENLVGVEDIGHKYDSEGNRVSRVGFSVSDNGQIVASKAFFGVVLVTYYTAYIIVEYNYERTEIIDARGRNIGSKLEGGEVLAINKGEVARHTVSLPQLRAETEKTELYKIISKTIINEDGEWERPPGWTGSAGGPTWPEGDPNPAEAHVEKKRVHEIGYTTKRGTVTKDEINILKADPKKFDNTYEIPLELEITEDKVLRDFGMNDSDISRAKGQIPVVN